MTQLDVEVFAEAARLIARWKRPLLLSHVTPDGDALGSLVGMRLLLQAQGIEGQAILLDPIPSRYASLRRFGPLPQWKLDVRASDLRDVDGIILLDVCTYKQLRPIADWLRAATVPKLAVDHHLTREDLADVYLIDESAAANTLILYEWARAVGWPIDGAIAEALFIGIAMDTGWFRHSSTDRRVFAACAELVARGAPAHRLFQELYLGESSGRIRLLAAALNRLELLSDDRLAVVALPTEAFAEAEAILSDTEDIVNEALRIATVVVSVLVVDKGDGFIRVGLRSKPPQDDQMPDIDVAAIAQSFGGGGHRRAAGARLPGTLREVRTMIVDRLQKVLGGVPEASGEL